MHVLSCHAASSLLVCSMSGWQMGTCMSSYMTGPTLATPCRVKTDASISCSASHACTTAEITSPILSGEWIHLKLHNW